LPGVRKVEYEHHSPEQVRGYLDEAVRILEERELRPELEVAALPQLVALLSSKTVQFEQVAPMLGGMAIPQNHRR